LRAGTRSQLTSRDPTDSIIKDSEAGSQALRRRPSGKQLRVAVTPAKAKI
jgi:hypothetical protein